MNWFPNKHTSDEYWLAFWKGMFTCAFIFIGLAMVVLIYISL